MDFEEFQVVVLRRPDDAPNPDPETLKASQEAHRAYLNGLRDADTIVANGAVLGAQDASIKGMVIYAAASVEEVRELAMKDPAVVDGRLVPEVFSWRIPKELMRINGTPVESRGA